MKILNFGSLNIDRTYDVDQFVRAGQTIASKKFQIFLGGKGLNQSLATARAGAEVYHVGVIGKDGASLKQALLDDQVHIDYLNETDGYSGHTVIQVDASGENCILFEAGTNQELTRDLIDQVLSDFSGQDLIVLTQNEVSNVDYILRRAKEEGHTVAFNPSPMDENVRQMPLDCVDYFLINETEGQALTGYEDTADIFKSMQDLYPSSSVLLTLGSQGCMFKDGSGEYQQEALKTQVVDTTAAGDTFTGYFLAGLSESDEIPTILRRASVASSMAIGQKGAANSIPYRSEVEEKIKEIG